MIININQTLAEGGQHFDVLYDDMPKYRGKLGSVSPLETFSLRSNVQKTHLTGAFMLPRLFDMVPFTYIFGRPKVVHNCYCQINSKRLGIIGCYEEGIRKTHHHITDVTGRKFDAYHFSEYNGNEYISIYIDDATQVAQIESSLIVEDSCSRYKLYLLDDYKDCADIFAMFVMYFDNWYNAKRLHATKGTSTKKKRATTSYTDKFNPEWHIVNFPQDDPEDRTAE